MSHHNNKKHCKKDCPKRCPPKCEPKCEKVCYDEWSCSEEDCHEPQRMKQVTVITRYRNLQCQSKKKEWGNSVKETQGWECVPACEKKFEKKDKCHKKRHH